MIFIFDDIGWYLYFLTFAESKLDGTKKKFRKEDAADDGYAAYAQERKLKTFFSVFC